jgi:hypothetical protein
MSDNSNQEPVEITQEQFDDWNSSEVTKAVIGELLIQTESLKNYIASGATLEKDPDVTTDRAIGRLEGIRFLFTMFTEKQEQYAKEAVTYDH